MRIQVGLVVCAVVACGSLGEAAAQTYPPPPLIPGDYYPAAPAPYPPPRAYGAPVPPMDVSEPPGVAPYPYRRGRMYRDANGFPVEPFDPYYDDQAADYPPSPYAPAARSAALPQPPAYGGEPFVRPPADVSGGPGAADVTGAIGSRPPAGADRANVIAALPPEDQPESGPARDLAPQLHRQLVEYPTSEPAGTVIVDTPHTFLYLVLGNGRALRYGIGVGREGFTWAGTERISRMSEWPDWHPPKEMIERQPYLPRFMAGGEGNPLGARALYLGSTVYRIHGTNQPSTIGHFVSSGCIRLTNEDVEDLYSRVSVGSRVVVLPGSASASARAPVAR